MAQSTNSMWPEGASDGRAVVVVAEAATPVEERAIHRWVARHRPIGIDLHIVVVPLPIASRPTVSSAALDGIDQRDDDVMLVPVRAVWLPSQRQEPRSRRMLDVLLGGDPRHPRGVLQRVLAGAAPQRLRVVVGEPATLGQLRTMHASSREARSLSSFVASRATLALDRAEREVFGPHYKVPRLVHEEIRTSARFRDGVARLAADLARTGDEVMQEADRCLDELCTGYGALQIDLAMTLGKKMYQQGYDEEIDFDSAQIEAVQSAVRDNASVILPSHRSMIDGGVVPVSLHELGLPKAHTLGGINMAFWPLGPILRRSGVIFIRRDTTGDPVYRFVLREYVGYLVEKRFPLSWYIEGARSRTGKLLPPRMGLLAYVIDAYREGRVDDVLLVPASITYDQLREVGDYVKEARGQTKRAEDFNWYVRYWRSLRGRYGRIYVRFGSPVSLRAALGPPDGGGIETDRVAVQKVALEVAWRINGVTPITSASLITMTALSALGQGLTFAQLRRVLDDFLTFAEQRLLPTTDSARALRTDEGLAVAVDALVRQDLLVLHEGSERVIAIGADQHVSAAFYRNSIIHFFLDASIAEVALAGIGDNDVDDPRSAFWNTAFGLRDLLKFDFFFAERETFRKSIEAEMVRLSPDWADALDQGPAGARSLIGSSDLLTAHITLRSFVEAYYAVAQTLVWHSDLVEERALLDACHVMAHQLLLQRRIRSEDADSRLLFKPALELARHRGLLEARSGSEREQFAKELRSILTSLDLIEQMAREQFAQSMAQGRTE